MSEMIEFALSGGHNVLIDSGDSDLLNCRWYFTRRASNGYAYRHIRSDGKISVQYLHRAILERAIGRQLARGEVADHINHNGLDNRRANLRLARQSENACNRRMNRKNTSGFHGVSRSRSGGWNARIVCAGKSHHLGCFDTARDAAIAYNHAAKRENGPFATLNDIPDWEQASPIPRGKKTSSSGSVGVYFIKNRWRAYAVVKRKSIYIGSYTTAREAKEARQDFLTNKPRQLQLF